MNNKKGISLIALIITIIVIIILAAIVIGGIFNTPTQAKYARFCNDVGAMQDAVLTAHGSRMVAVSTDINSDRIDNSKIYKYIATGSETATTETIREKEMVKVTNGHKLNIQVPEYTNQDWYIDVSSGEVYLYPGFTYQEKLYMCQADINAGGTESSGSGEQGGETTGLTLGSLYDSSAIKIGDKVDYSSQGVTDWIIFGKDTSGNILITSEQPIADGFTVNLSAEQWLSYEDDIDDACSIYGGTLKGTEVETRSIKMADINRVVGFTEPSFRTYTFGTTSSAAYDDETGDFYWASNDNNVDYYYPSYLVEPKSEMQSVERIIKERLIAATTPKANMLLAAGEERTAADNTYPYFVKAGGSIPSQNFACDAYYYYNDGGTYKLSCEGTNRDWADVNTTLTNADNMAYVIGGSGNYFYLVGSRSVYVRPNGASFSVAGVGKGGVDSGRSDLCGSSSDSAGDVEGSETFPVRPVVILPSNIPVEEVSEGVYDIVHAGGTSGE